MVLPRERCLGFVWGTGLSTAMMAKWNFHDQGQSTSECPTPETNRSRETVALKMTGCLVPSQTIGPSSIWQSETSSPGSQAQKDLSQGLVPEIFLAGDSRD